MPTIHVSRLIWNRAGAGLESLFTATRTYDPSFSPKVSNLFSVALCLPGMEDRSRTDWALRSHLGSRSAIMLLRASIIRASSRSSARKTTASSPFVPTAIMTMRASGSRGIQTKRRNLDLHLTRAVRSASPGTGPGLTRQDTARSHLGARYIRSRPHAGPGRYRSSVTSPGNESGRRVSVAFQRLTVEVAWFRLSAAIC